MFMPWDLEDWLTEAGGRVVQKMADCGHKTLTPEEQLIYEVWLFDTETRNGGVSQYFGNRGIEQWRSLRTAAESQNLPRLKQFMDEVDLLIGEAADPYAVSLAVSPPIEEVYWRSHQTGIVEELRRMVSERD
ncbi:DMP19 family protein [Zavarzinella formosa]|uniref:DMP19 family protein n=1 Tax=Zavarzinella formosa TaxID=360055 RepID=UPI00030EA040|nr:DUF4375 domain-containing protein [Zavarzinella formosa]